MENTLKSGLLIIMRTFLLLIGIGLSSAYGNPISAQKKIQIDVRDLSVEQFFQVIQDKSEFIFFYKDDVVETQKRISLTFKDAKVSTVLDKAFSGTNLIYRIIGKQIIVKRSWNNLSWI